MGVSKPKVRAAMSLAVALGVAGAFTLSSFAAPNVNDGPPGEKAGVRLHKVLPGALTGRLTGTGPLTIDGYEAQSGTTVLSGSTVSTGTGGRARIDLGSLGSFELRPNTTIALVFASGTFQVRMNGAGLVVNSLSAGVTGQVKILGERSRVIVSRGHVKVDSTGDALVLKEGQGANFSQACEATTTGEAVFTAESGGDDDGTPTGDSGENYHSPGRYGVAAMIGAAGAIILGVTLGGNGDKGSSLPKASTVVP